MGPPVTMALRMEPEYERVPEHMEAGLFITSLLPPASTHALDMLSLSSGVMLKGNHELIDGKVLSNAYSRNSNSSDRV